MILVCTNDAHLLKVCVLQYTSSKLTCISCSFAFDSMKICGFIVFWQNFVALQDDFCTFAVLDASMLFHFGCLHFVYSALSDKFIGLVKTTTSGSSFLKGQQTPFVTTTGNRGATDSAAQ